MRFLIRGANRTVAAEDGLIVEPGGRYDAVLNIPGGEVRPGLINAHEHLHRNHFGRLGRPPYPNAYAWGRDIHLRDADRIQQGRAVPRRAALLFGARRNLLAGVTTVVHHDPWEPDFDEDFPLRVARVRTAHSLGFESDFQAAAESGPAHLPICVHLAEGTDAAAADEVRELERRGWLDDRLIAVHAVGADTDGVDRLRRSGAAVVWCPSSNRFLLGRTAPAELLAPGMDVLLGSDSLLSGAGTLLDELRAARAEGLVDDERLLAAVGDTAARRLALPPPTLEPGSPADLAVFTRPVLDASPADVALVMVAGVPRVADPVLLPDLEGAGVALAMRRAGGLERAVSPALAPAVPAG